MLSYQQTFWFLVFITLCAVVALILIYKCRRRIKGILTFNKPLVLVWGDHDEWKIEIILQRNAMFNYTIFNRDAPIRNTLYFIDTQCSSGLIELCIIGQEKKLRFKILSYEKILIELV